MAWPSDSQSVIARDKGKAFAHSNDDVLKVYGFGLRLTQAPEAHFRFATFAFLFAAVTATGFVVVIAGVLGRVLPVTGPWAGPDIIALAVVCGVVMPPPMVVGLVMPIVGPGFGVTTGG